MEWPHRNDQIVPAKAQITEPLLGRAAPITVILQNLEVLETNTLSNFGSLLLP